jgi:hypothetical protein
MILDAAFAGGPNVQNVDDDDDDDDDDDASTDVLRTRYFIYIPAFSTSIPTIVPYI